VEKINKRVSKRFLMLLTMTIVILILAVVFDNDKNYQGVMVEQTVTQNVSGVLPNFMLPVMLNEPIKMPEPLIPIPLAQPKPVAQPVVNKVEQPKEENWSTYRLSHYIARCSEGCTGITRTGINVRNTTRYQGYRVIAVDTSLIPLGSIVEIDDGDNVYEAIAIDTGGAIRGHKLDLLVGSTNEALKLGVKQVKLRIMREGWES
jgi:3D (Asp-Asp-Asp) domain-containing protein